ncbi:MAG: DUF3656 domain-containing protein [Lachnospiraceae bacterium]
MQSFLPIRISGFHREKLNGKLRISLGKPVILSLNYGGFSAEVSGAAAEPAQKSALTRESVEKQLRKTGNTEFTFDQLEIELDEGCFLPVQALKELRREGIEKLSGAVLGSSRRSCPEKLVPESFSGEKAEEPYLAVLVSDARQAETLLNQPGIRRFYLESDLLLEQPETFFRLRETIQGQEKECFLAMPPFSGQTRERFLRRKRQRGTLLFRMAFLCGTWKSWLI